MTAHTDGESAQVRPGGTAGWRLPVAVLLALLLLVAVALGIWGYVRLGSADEDLDARGEVTRVAERFMVQFNTYDPEGVEEYTGTVNEMLSTSARTAFSEQIEDITTLIRETDLKSQGEVLVSGVASLDPDSARVLVVADAQATSQAGTVDRHFRWQIDLVKVDGEWLVDDFNPVA